MLGTVPSNSRLQEHLYMVQKTRSPDCYVPATLGISLFLEQIRCVCLSAFVLATCSFANDCQNFIA